MDNLYPIEMAMGVAIAASPVAIIIRSVLLKKGMGVRAIQFLAVSTIVPGVILLALLKMLEGETVAAIFSGMIGYLLAQISKFDERES